MTMEEYIHSEAERRAKEMAETLAKPMAESLAASKIAQNIVALLAELGSVPEELRECIAAEKREDTLAAWLKLQYARILLKSSSLKCRDRSVSFLIGSINR